MRESKGSKLVGKVKAKRAKRSLRTMLQPSRTSNYGERFQWERVC